MRRIAAIALASLALLLPMPAQASSSLGLSINVIPSDNPEVRKVSTGQSLWFVVPPGSSQTREFIIVSSSSKPEVVDFSLGFLGRVDGEAVFDDAKVADSKGWASFSPSTITLPAHGTTKVTFTYSIPSGTDIGTHEAFLFATASSANSKSDAEYKVPQNARIAMPVFLGVGTTDQIRSDFEIKGLQGSTADGHHNARIFFQNTGKTPIHLDGNIQLSSAVFKSDVIGPLLFNSVTIRAGEKAFVDVPVPDTMVEGKYDAFIQASQGAITKTAHITTDISFNGPNPIIGYAIRGGFVFFFLLVIYFAWRYLKRTKKEVRPPVAQESETSDLEIEKFLAELAERAKKRVADSVDIPEYRTTAKKRAAKKALAKKSAAKKVAKKAPAKKAAVKKVVKKAVTKKVVKKAVVKKKR